MDEFQTLLNKSNDTMELVAQEKPFLTETLMEILMPGHQNSGRIIRQLKKVFKEKTLSRSIFPFTSNQ